MKNDWSDLKAKKYIKKYTKLGHSKDMALRVYTTRLLGRNSELVLHGGGNTSVKSSIQNPEDCWTNRFAGKLSMPSMHLPWPARWLF